MITNQQQAGATRLDNNPEFVSIRHHQPAAQAHHVTDGLKGADLQPRVLHVVVVTPLRCLQQHRHNLLEEGRQRGALACGDVQGRTKHRRLLQACGHRLNATCFKTNNDIMTPTALTWQVQ
jgi:hypothetical protein